MTRHQFHVLYRQFLFRMVDLELLAPQGDITRLLGQFAGLLVFFSATLALGGLFFDSRMPPEALLPALWSRQHALIAMTMLVVGLFAVLSWDSTFPDRRDVMVLLPLPVTTPTLFLAKVAALGTALSLTVVALNALTSLIYPLHFAPAGSGILGILRSVAAYWATMFAAGAFLFFCVLMVQGLAAQLPRRWFLRLSTYLQMATLCLFLSVYLLQPNLTTPAALAGANQQLLAWLPSYWFLGFFQELNGSSHPAMHPLATRAWIACILSGLGGAASFLLSYIRTPRKIMEEPDILPAAGRWRWSLPFGRALETAVTHFSIRTLLRSRQHRVILAFYLGVAFTLLIALARSNPVGSIAEPVLAASLLLMVFWVVGTRVAFAMPLELRANWIFRITVAGGRPACLAASRRSLVMLSVVPAWAISAAWMLANFPWRPVAVHLIVLGLIGIILADLCMHGFPKIPFTCSYLPGKSQVHLICLGAGSLLYAVPLAIRFECQALENPAAWSRMLLVLLVAAGAARWRAKKLAGSEETELRYEEEPPPAIFALDVHKDGVISIQPKQS